MSAIHAYEVLYSQVLRLSKDYQSSIYPVYKTIISAVCSDGSICDTINNPIYGKMTILMGMTGGLSVAPSGSLYLALLQSNDNPFCPTTVWGSTQAQNLLNLCNIFGFTYTGPFLTPNVITAFATTPPSTTYYSTQNTGVGLIASGSSSGSNIISTAYTSNHGGAANILFFGFTIANRGDSDKTVVGLNDAYSNSHDNSIYFDLRSDHVFLIFAGAPFLTLEHDRTQEQVYSGEYAIGDKFAIVMDFSADTTTCYQNEVAITFSTPNGGLYPFAPVTDSYVNAFLQIDGIATDTEVFTNIQLSTTYPTA